ncbi:MAG: alpha/beta fold hydrolase [bacterium]|nr:alpha/beta fold hydrolase [bacterium]
MKLPSTIPLLICLFISNLLTAQSLSVIGSWQGTMLIQGQPLNVLLHITKQSDNGLKGTFDSPDQKAFGIPFTEVTFSNSILKCDLSEMQLMVSGELLPTDSLQLVWQQGPAIFPLKMSRIRIQERSQTRPQEPTGELPYSDKQVSFENKLDHLNLKGTLTMPKGTGPFPAVVLISGSGPQNRNSAVFDHQPFLVLSDYLTRHGIAVLRYDDRGTGESEGQFKSATSIDFANDANAAFNFLFEQSGIDKKKIGLAGHSEGGMIAPMVAVQNKKVCFNVLIAGPALPIDSLMYEQIRLTMEVANTPEIAIKTQLIFNHQLFNYLKAMPTYEMADAGLDSFIRQVVITQMGKDTSGLFATVKFQVEKLRPTVTPWFYYFINYQPKINLSHLTIPA